MVPNGWNKVTLEEIVEPDASIRYGVVQIGQDTEGGVPIVPIKFINLIESSTLHRASKEIESSYVQSRIQGGDVLLSVKGTIGMVGVVPQNFNGNIAREIARIRPSNNYDPTYIAFQLQAEKTQRRIEKLTVGTTRREFSIHAVRKFSIQTPPLPEQKKIAQILSTWDQTITAIEQLLANSQQQKKALMQKLLTGKKRLHDQNGQPFTGEWKKGKLGDIANIDSGYAFKSRDFTDLEFGVPIIRMSDFKSGGIDISGAVKVVREAISGLDRFSLRTGDFIFGMSGSLSNYGWVKKQDLPCFLNQRVGRILSKECTDQMFVTYLYLSDQIQQAILDKAAGAAQLNINVSDLRNTIVHYPNLEEQLKIAAVLTSADNEIETLQQKLKGLKHEKKALMQQLLTGKRRVRVS